MLDTLYDYCNEWKLEVNVWKTKIVTFGNGEMYTAQKIGRLIITILYNE